jgi:hypothetical protein
MLAACGSDRLSAAGLRTRASGVCDAARKQTNLIPPPGSPAQAAVFLRRGIAFLKPELTGLKALSPPSDEAQVYVTALDAFSHKLAALVQTLNELTGGADPVNAIKQLQQRLSPIEAAENGAWQALEIPSCLNR